MKNSISVNLIFSFLFLFLSIEVKAEIAPIVAYAKHVYDGDTFNVEYKGREYRIRVEGIDCPEISQQYGDSAKNATQALVHNNQVLVYPKSIGRYGRLIASITVGRRNLAIELVRNGFCRWYSKYTPNNSVLKQLEIEAFQQKKGIWANQEVVSPWEYRLQH